MVLTSFPDEPTPLAIISPLNIQHKNTLCPADVEDSGDANRQHISKCTTGTGLYEGPVFELIKHKAFNRLKIISKASQMQKLIGKKTKKQTTTTKNKTDFFFLPLDPKKLNSLNLLKAVW